MKRKSSILLVAISAAAFAGQHPIQAMAYTPLANGGLLQSWEPPVDPNDPADGWYVPSWGKYGSSENSTSEATGNAGPATDGVSSLEVDDPNTDTSTTDRFAWTAGWANFGGSEQNNGAAMLSTFDQAVANGASNYSLSLDVIYKTADIPASTGVQYPWINGALLFQWDNAALDASTDGPNGANYAQHQIDSIATTTPAQDSVQQVLVPLSEFTYTGGTTGTTYHFGDDSNIYWIQMYLAVNGSFDAGQPVTVFYDNLRLRLNGDVNSDGSVDSEDFGVLNSNYGKAVTGGYADGDLNEDGTVNGDDWALFSIYAAQYQGLVAAVPEPASMSLLALGGLVVLRRRRQV